MGEPSAVDISKKIASLLWNGQKRDTSQYYTIALVNNSTKDQKKKKQISTNSPMFKTPAQISCGSTLAYIKIQHPTLKKANETYLDHEERPISIYDEAKRRHCFRN
jgi:hypothetical protein